MRDNKTILAEKLASLLDGQGVPLTAAEAVGLFETPADPKLGDLALPCFKLAKLLRSAPPKIASELVSAFAGREHVLRAYQEAIEKRYRFFSFGDAMLIL